MNIENDFDIYSATKPEMGMMQCVSICVAILIVIILIYYWYTKPKESLDPRSLLIKQSGSGIPGEHMKGVASEDRLSKTWMGR